MTVQFRLIDFHQQTSSLQVLYYNDDLPQGVNFSLNVPIVEGAYIHGDELEQFIRSYIPHDIFDRAAQARTTQLTGELADLAASRPTSNPLPQILEDRQIFVVEDNQRILFVRPLVQMNVFEIPVEII